MERDLAHGGTGEPAVLGDDIVRFSKLLMEEAGRSGQRRVDELLYLLTFMRWRDGVPGASSASSASPRTRFRVSPASSACNPPSPNASIRPRKRPNTWASMSRRSAPGFVPGGSGPAAWPGSGRCAFARRTSIPCFSRSIRTKSDPGHLPASVDSIRFCLMPLYRVRRDVGPATQEDIDAASFRAIVCAPQFPGLKWIRSYWDPTAERIDCYYEAVGPGTTEAARRAVADPLRRGR